MSSSRSSSAWHQLQEIAGQHLARIRLAKTRKETEEKFSPEALDLLDFVPAVSPRWERPDHLAPVADAFARSCTEPVDLLLSCPPQHGKTELILHGIAWRLKRDPTLQVFYVSYSADVARTKSRLLRDYALRAGVELREDARAIGEWVTPEGGGVVAGGFAGFTSRPCQLLVIDDPYGSREDAESAAYREHVHEFYKSTLRIRVHPGGSKIVVHTRWHRDDLIGRLSTDPEWHYINLAAIGDRGEALWPSHRPLAYLEKIRADDDYNWWSLFMGAPRPRGTEVFGSPSYYDELPASYYVTVGVDLAYSEKTRADWSVAVVMAHEFTGVLSADGTAVYRSYVLEVVRRQARPEDFATNLQQLRSKYPGAKFHTYVASSERGGPALLRSLGGVPIVGHPATADKFVRAQPVAAAWNRQLVPLPSVKYRKAHADEDFSWLQPYIDEVGAFTGVNDTHDDQVDASASARDAGRKRPSQGEAAPPIEPRPAFEDRPLRDPF